MSNDLPNTNDFKNFKLKLIKENRYKDIPKVDVLKYFNSIKNNKIPKGFIGKLFPIDILTSKEENQSILKKYFKFDTYHNSLVICLYDENNQIITTAIHRANNSLDTKGNVIKYKSYGSKHHISYNIKDNFVFIVYGMLDIVLMELLGYSYIGFQMDSTAKDLKNNEQWKNKILPKLKNKYVILLIDNDYNFSCLKTVRAIKRVLKDIATVIPLTMYKLNIMNLFEYGGTDKRILSAGYDIRDFVNEIQNPLNLEHIITELIKIKI